MVLPIYLDSRTINVLHCVVMFPEALIISEDHLIDYSTPLTPTIARALSSQAPPQLGKLNFSGPPILSQDSESSSSDDSPGRVAPPPAYTPEFTQHPLSEAASGGLKVVPSWLDGSPNLGCLVRCGGFLWFWSRGGLRARHQHQDLSALQSSTPEQESRDGHHHPSSCVR